MDFNGNVLESAFGWISPIEVLGWSIVLGFSLLAYLFLSVIWKMSIPVVKDPTHPWGGGQGGTPSLELGPGWKIQAEMIGDGEFSFEGANVLGPPVAGLCGFRRLNTAGENWEPIAMKENPLHAMSPMQADAPPPIWQLQPTQVRKLTRTVSGELSGPVPLAGDGGDGNPQNHPSGPPPRHGSRG